MIRRLLATAVANAKADPGWRECIRLVAGWTHLRAISALFIASVVLPVTGAEPAWPHEDPLLWACAWVPAFIALTLLAEWADVSGLRGHDLDNR
ncbi:hypothetical protein [Methylorubrum zatmanii]|nr:hypothetical protein [Methylorubrum zatmanii]MBD8909419.1 hypothetical protein [Methylorubrum zatmanii]